MTSKEKRQTVKDAREYEYTCKWIEKKIEKIVLTAFAIFLIGFNLVLIRILVDLIRSI